MRAIDADELKIKISGEIWELNRAEICKVIDKQPTIEPQPQRTGRWVFDENDYLTKCSECGCHPWFGVIPTVKEATKKLPHCPVCLAKMEVEDD